MDQTVRQANVAVLFKLETTEGVDANPSPLLDAIPVESDSVTKGQPWTTEDSNEATGSLVSGAPLIIGQTVPLSFKSRIKGAGNGQVYSASVKPPLHPVLQACGWRGQFTSAIATAIATAGGTSQVTLANAFPATADALIGMPLLVTAGVGVGAMPLVSDYSAARVATLVDVFGTPLDTTSSLSLPANWTYAQTTPTSAAARATDMPSGTVYMYVDGVLWKYVAVRGTLSLDGQNARPGYATFNGTGVFAGRVDTPNPTNLVIAGHSAPVLAQGSSISPAVLAKYRPLPISTWSLDPGSQLEAVDDPNTAYGFGPGQIVDRKPILKVDPLATTVAARDTITDMGAGTTFPAGFRCGSIAGNRWSLTLPVVQPVDSTDGNRGKLMSEQISLQCRNSGADAFSRDTDRVLCFS